MVQRILQPQTAKNEQQHLTFEEANNIFRDAQKALETARSDIAKDKLRLDQLDHEIRGCRQGIQRLQSCLDFIIQVVGHAKDLCPLARQEYNSLSLLQSKAQLTLCFKQEDHAMIRINSRAIQHAADTRYDRALEGLKHALEQS